MTPFERVTREMNPFGCPCACHSGVGLASGCEHCRPIVDQSATYSHSHCFCTISTAGTSSSCSS